MIDVTDAQRIAQAHFDAVSIGHDYDLVVRNEKIIEKKYGWIITSVTQQYLDRDPRHILMGEPMLLVGQPCVVVEREDGSLYSLDNSYGLESAIADYEAWRFFNFTSIFYDLTIRLVRDLEKSVELLGRVTLVYAKSVPTPTGGEIVIPYPYNREHIRELLYQVPVTLHHQKIRHFFRVFQEIDDAKCCEYDIVPSQN